jgi:hypothetical protein
MGNTVQHSDHEMNDDDHRRPAPINHARVHHPQLATAGSTPNGLRVCHHPFRTRSDVDEHVAAYALVIGRE